ncbi:hypothetical protein ACHAXA_009777 [Cyclostephanos tholiformis]|uniref:B30.2/SPRY domain-containing protein n=1 Tax=Cyclostephanos tholiformis TaxID=382380 RepID=A0ABD3SHA3_9STRA
MPFPRHILSTTTKFSQCEVASAAVLPPALQVPVENILSVASFLPVRDIFSLASSCRYLRATLMSSQGATTCIWMRIIREAFPDVFRNHDVVGTASPAMDTPPGSPPIDDAMNLPLLTHLLPDRYPHSIDIGELKSDNGPFRRYEAESSSILPRVSADVVRFVQFEGRVGTGNRSIRSDQPFPAICNNCIASTGKKSRLGSRLIKLKKMNPFKLELMNENGDSRRNDEITAVHRRLHNFIGHIRQAMDSNDCLRPFVIPTLISTKTSSTDRNGEDTGLMIDLTPRLVAYYEVTIVRRALDITSSEVNASHDYHHECISIGLSTGSFCIQGKMPGWDFASYGYHSDDGGIFHGTGIPPRRRRPPYGPGDVVGCGLDYEAGRIFFTKNGRFLGYEFDKVGEDVVEGGLFPTVGVDSECPIFVNFGERPFYFDLKNIKV